MKNKVRKYAVIALVFTFLFCPALALLSFCNHPAEDVLIVDESGKEITSSINLGAIGLGEEKSKEIKLVSKLKEDAEVSFSTDRLNTESVYPYVFVSAKRGNDTFLDNKSLSCLRGLTLIDKTSLPAWKSLIYTFQFRVAEDVPEEIWGKDCSFSMVFSFVSRKK